ncbi:MAG: hypothetical protein MZV64_48545 [Ignavibacteriales bacterium]|nr:hypothetical protein [Ignavibacteriales bacterium]
MHGAGPGAAAVGDARLAPGEVRRQRHADDDRLLQVRRPVRHPHRTRLTKTLRLRPLAGPGACRQGQGADPDQRPGARFRSSHRGGFAAAGDRRAHRCRVSGIPFLRIWARRCRAVFLEAHRVCAIGCADRTCTPRRRAHCVRARFVVDQSSGRPGD